MGNAYGFGQVIYKTTTLAFTGLAVSLGIRAGLFNVGAESQLAAGGFRVAIAGLFFRLLSPALLRCLFACLPRLWAVASSEQYLAIFACDSGRTR